MQHVSQSAPRRDDWPAVLAAEIEAARVRPFVWGTHDCALWVARVVTLLTGRDWGERFRGQYDTPRGAKRVQLKCGSLAVIATRALGDPVSVRLARRGDVVLACRDNGPALGICDGPRCAFAAPEGLSFLPLLECEQAWHV